MDGVVDEVSIAGRAVGPRHPCFVIAEAGVNHDGYLEIALRLVHVAADAGVDAVKFQTFTADRLVAEHAPKADYQRRRPDDDESQLDMLRKLELSPSAHRKLLSACQQRGILFLSAPFDEEDADSLSELDLPAFKVPSGELTNLPFLEHVARKGKPMIVSTGMASLAEVAAAVQTIQDAGNRDLILLHCVSHYPASPSDVNLRAMHTMAAAFGVPIGYSDHTLGIEVSLAAVALGACVIEKHFTLNRGLPGPDHRASLEPDELAALVRGIRVVESALGHGRKEPAAGEAGIAQVVRKSLVAAKDVPAGTVLTDALIAMKRPGTGLPPTARSLLIGRKTKQDVPAGTLLTLEMLA